MVRYLKLLFLLLGVINLYAEPIEIKKDATFKNLLPQSQIYIDNDRDLQIADIMDKKVVFKENNSSLLAYGFSPNFDVWVKFTLVNNSDETIHKTLEYANPLTSYIEFYNPDKSLLPQKDGLFSIDENRKTINPSFDIVIEANTTTTFYLKASSYITTLIVDLGLWNTKAFYEQETTHQAILALFFGAMSILGLYNLFIFFFTKDKSYLFYFFYLFGVIIHHSIYRGVGVIHLLNQEWIIYSILNASLISSFPIFALALFTKTFLETKNYPTLDKILNLFIIVLPISVAIFILTDEFNKYRNILAVMTLGYLLFVTIYASLKKNRQAYFILTGWFAIFLAILFMLLSSTGIFDIYTYFPYFIEASLVFEAVVFSLALADRIKQLQLDKEIANQQLISQKESERKRLSLLVEEKTYDLKIALEEKSMLFKELHHRVKNNMQIIISLIRLQKDDIKDLNLREILTTTQNRISTMKHLHEMLYQQDKMLDLNTYEYFNLLIEEIQQSYLDENITIDIDIKADLKIDQAVYCGIMLNELITNSFKYAFKNAVGKIDINLFKKGTLYTLVVCDNGVGYKKEDTSNSLGLTLVHTIAKKQLKGDIDINSSNGVKVKIEWTENEKS